MSLSRKILGWLLLLTTTIQEKMVIIGQCVCNVSHVSTQISDIIANKYELDTMKRKAREYAESELDFEKNFKQLHNVLSSVKFDNDYEKTAQAILHKDKVGMKKYLFVIETLVTIKKMFG